MLRCERAFGVMLLLWCRSLEWREMEKREEAESELQLVARARARSLARPLAFDHVARILDAFRLDLDLENAARLS